MANGGTCYVGGVANAAGQAACQAQPGANWVPDAPEQQQSTSNPWGTAAKVGLGLASLHPAGRLLGWGLKGAKALKSGAPMTGRMGNMMDKLFRKDVMKPKIVPPPKNFVGPPNPAIPAVLEKGRALSPMKMGYAGGGTVLAGTAFQGRGGGAEQRALTEQANNAKILAELMDRQKQIDDAKKNEETPKKELTFAEKVKIGLKDKDTVYKLGALMKELGNNDPNRASELLALNKAEAAGASKTYTALKNMILSPAEITKQIFIDGGGTLGFGGMDEDEKEAAAQQRGNAINALMHELAMMGQLPTMENAQALYNYRNPPDEPKPATDEEDDKWYKFFS